MFGKFDGDEGFELRPPDPEFRADKPRQLI